MRLPTRSQPVGLAVAVALTSVAQSTALDDRSVGQFLRELQRDVARDDRPAVAARIQYPLVVLAGGLRIPIKDAASLVQQYDIVFSPALKALIDQAAVPAPGRSDSPASVAVGIGFARIGADAVRIEPAGDQLKITRITVPLDGPAAASPSPAAPTGVGSAPAATPKTKRGPQRLFIDVGQIQLSGALRVGERDSYVLSAAKNQLFELHINRVSGRDIVARITNVKKRVPIDSRAQTGVRAWIGRIPENGDYRIDVERLAAIGGSQLPYLLVVSLR